MTNSNLNIDDTDPRMEMNFLDNQDDADYESDYDQIDEGAKEAIPLRKKIIRVDEDTTEYQSTDSECMTNSNLNIDDTDPRMEMNFLDNQDDADYESDYESIEAEDEMNVDFEENFFLNTKEPIRRLYKKLEDVPEVEFEDFVYDLARKAYTGKTIYETFANIFTPKEKKRITYNTCNNEKIKSFVDLDSLLVMHYLLY